MRVGVEVGGTFTDLVAIGEDGITVTKVPSVPRQPDEGAFNALLQSRIPISSVEDLTHGSTVATNAVLERKGFATAFITTQGFRDILRLQRHGRSRIYDLEYVKPEPVVARAACYEVSERIRADGSIQLALDLDRVDLRHVDLEQRFDSVLDVLLVGGQRNLENDLVLFRQKCGLLGDHRRPDNFIHPAFGDTRIPITPLHFRRS